MSEGLKFTINPEHEAVSLDLFVRAWGDLRRLLDDLSYALYRERNGRHWVIRELHGSEPTVSVNLLPGDVASVAAVARGIGEVAAGTERSPEFFTEASLEDLRRMRRLFRGRDRAHSIVVALDGAPVATIQEDIGDKAGRILAGGYWRPGYVEGPLKFTDFPKAPTFTIWDRVSRVPVRCSLESDLSWQETAKGLVGKRVRVTGRVHCFQNGVPRRIVDISDTEEITPSPAPEGGWFGSIPDPEAAKDPVAFLHAIRSIKSGSGN